MYRGFNESDPLGSISRIRDKALRQEYVRGTRASSGRFNFDFPGEQPEQVYKNTANVSGFMHARKAHEPVSDTFLGMDMRGKFTPGFKSKVDEFTEAAGTSSQNRKDFSTAYNAGKAKAENPFDGSSASAISRVASFPTLGLKFKGDVIVNSQGKTMSKAEVKSHYKNLVKKNHPDIGGDPNVMVKITKELKELQNNPKFQKLAGFIMHKESNILKLASTLNRFEKRAFFAVAPFKNKAEDEYDSFGGYARE